MRAAAARRALEHGNTLMRIARHPTSNREQLLHFQQRKMRFLLQHAYGTVPYYRALFDDAGVRPEDIRVAADLARLPVTSKQTRRNLPTREATSRALNSEKLIDIYTSGSTGVPMHIRRSQFEDYLLNVFRMRTDYLMGVHPRDRTVRLAVGSVASNRHPRSFKPLKEALGIYRVKPINSVNDPRRIARKTAAAAPDVFRGFPSVLAEVASVWSEVAPDAPKPHLVISGGGTLTRSMRACIGANLGARVLETYAAYEVNLIGWECGKSGGIHVCDDNVIVEILRDGRPVAEGESGDVVVTNLHVHSAPIIRYAIGDIATRGQDTCECGAPFARIERILGRTMDYCVLPDGRFLHLWKILPESFHEMLWYKRYQLLQKSRECLVLRIVPYGEPPAEEVAAIERETRATLGPGCEFHVEFVDEIAREPSGKYRICRSAIGIERAADRAYADSGSG